MCKNNAQYWEVCGVKLYMSVLFRLFTFFLDEVPYLSTLGRRLARSERYPAVKDFGVQNEQPTVPRPKWVNGSLYPSDMWVSLKASSSEEAESIRARLRRERDRVVEFESVKSGDAIYFNVGCTTAGSASSIRSEFGLQVTCCA
jgi:hypothetical protein